jgi:glycerol uptake facilitator-like aquaporin
MAAPPTTPQKLAAEFLGTAFLVFVGAGSAAFAPEVDFFSIGKVLGGA